MLTVGQILKQARKEKGYSLIEIEKAIKVRQKFLQDVENNQWKNFSSKIYIVGIIKNYAKFLGIASQKAIAFFYRDYEKIEDLRFRKNIPTQYLTPQTKKMIGLMIFFIFAIFFSYFGYQLINYFRPPKVVLLAPERNVIKKGEAVNIIARTEKDAVITIANERIFQNEDGVFEFKYPLKPGKNTLTIEVVGANGKKTTLNKDFFLQPGN